MTRKIALLVVALPFPTFADGAVTGKVVSHMTSMPEANTLGLLGSGLIGIAFMVRRKLKGMPARRAAQKRQLSQAARTIERTAA